MNTSRKLRISILGEMGLIAVIILAPFHVAAVSLTGLTEFSTNASGDFSGGQLWNTLGGDGAWNLYVANGGTGGSFLNSGDSAATSPNITLALGSTTFGILAEEAQVISHFGLNLFFDGSTTPGISVFAPFRTAAAIPAFSANSATSTGGILPFLNLVPGAGTLSFESGGFTVTLTDYFWEGAGMVGISSHADRVSPLNNIANGTPDFTGQFTLTVSSSTVAVESRTWSGIKTLYNDER